MKVVHLSDTHLGYRNFHRIDSDTGINQREQDVYDSFERIIDQVLETDPDLVVHAGDLFDTVRPTNRAVNVATEQFARLSQKRIPTVVIAGNHDTPKIATTGTIMQSLDQLPHIHAVTSDSAQEHGGYREIDVGEMSVHAVSDAPLKDELHDRLDSVEPNSNAEWNILVLHAGVRQVQDQVYSGEFNEHYVTTDFLNTTGMDYVALGHYHKRMPIDCEVQAHYSGSIERFSFDESEYEPGYLELEFDDDISIEEKTITTRSFFTLPDIDASGMSVDELKSTIEGNVPNSENREGGLFSVTINNIEPSQQSILKDVILSAIREKMFETRIQMIDPEGDVTTGEDLQFQDLRKEFDQYLDELDRNDEEKTDAILETGQKYLSRAMDEEDNI